MADFEGKNSSNDIINNEAMSDDEVVASYLPPRYLLGYWKKPKSAKNDANFSKNMRYILPDGGMDRRKNGQRGTDKQSNGQT